MTRGTGRSRGGLLRHNLQLGERSSNHGARQCGETLRQMPEPDEEWLHEASCREPIQTALNETQHPQVGEVSACEALETIESFSEGINLPFESHDTQLLRKRSLTREGVGPSKRKGRGPAIGMGKPDKDNKPIIKFLNGRPVSSNRDCFITKIGIWAKDQSRFPFKTQNFDSLPEAEWKRLEEDLNDYFDIRYQGDLRKLIKRTCRRIWNDERSKMYRRNYACYPTHEEALRHPPKGMNPDTWRTICEDVFLGDNWKERSTRNTSNRSQQDILHKSGRTSFAQRAETMRGELRRSPTRAEVFQKCYKGKNGYVNAATEEATERLVAMTSQCPENEDAIFREVLGPERKGRKRGMGWTTNPDADITLLRSKIEKMTTELAERDARDKERDIKDAQIQQKIVELENKFESLSRCLVMQVPPQAPHQFLTSQFPFEQQIQRPYYQPLMPSFMEHLQSGSVGNNGSRMFGGSNRDNEE